MKRQSFRRRNSILGGYPWLGPAALACLVLVLIFATLRFFLPGALVAVASPFWKTGGALSAGVGNTASFFSDKAKLAEERDRLEAENAALSARAAVLEARASDLTRLLGARTEPSPGVLASVIARPPVSPYDVLIIDAGSEAGVLAGQQVRGAGGVPVGIVEAALARSSRVLLYSTPSVETESWVGETRMPVTLVGMGSGSMHAVVSRDAGIVAGDMVYVAGEGALPVGTVVAVANDPSSPRSRIDIRPIANPFSITWVTVVP